jgi:beta-phosphoglucomutase family hydrolase
VSVRANDPVCPLTRAVTAERFDAVLFDLDGVLTDTASVHARCWKQVFDEVLARRARGDAARPFDVQHDYLRYVDGKPRLDGVRDFLRSRGLELPEGGEGDARDADSVRAIARRKNALIETALVSGEVDVYPGSVRWLDALREQALRTAVVSSSHHCMEVLEAAGLADRFDVRVDGNLIDARGLPGKPAPDAFLEAARALGVAPERAVVVEDASAGVRAGRAGGFGLVVGVARHDNASDLSAAGADLVVHDLAEMLW